MVWLFLCYDGALALVGNRVLYLEIKILFQDHIHMAILV